MTTHLPPLTIADVIDRMPVPPDLPRLARPEYRPTPDADAGNRIFLSVESFRRHMTDEGWQIQAGMEAAGYQLWGHGLPASGSKAGETDVAAILAATHPTTAIIQDPREWDASTDNCFDKRAQFHNAEILGQRPDIFKVGILKDAHRSGAYYREAWEKMGCHAWIVYYHPDLVAAMAPWARKEHFIRTYHTVDGGDVPPFTADGRRGCLLSGATSERVYPLRTRMAKATKRGKLPSVTVLKHPGYHAKGSHTPQFLRLLTAFKVSICTASVFGFALRKIMESTACGCRVVTDLPVDEVLPYIDGEQGNLIRVNPGESPRVIDEIVREAEQGWDEERQRWLADVAATVYDWRAEGAMLAAAVEEMRKGYGS